MAVVILSASIRRLKPSVVIAVLASAILGIGFAVPAYASAASANTISYKNNGTYAAEFYIEYNHQYDGKSVRCRLKERNDQALLLGEGQVYNLRKELWQVVKGSTKTCLIEVYDAAAKAKTFDIPVGVEVWGVVRIQAGQTKSCRKDKRIIYQKNGGTVRYRTGGTTFNNNRCKVSSWP